MNPKQNGAQLLARALEAEGVARGREEVEAGAQEVDGASVALAALWSRLAQLEPSAEGQALRVRPQAGGRGGGGWGGEGRRHGLLVHGQACRPRFPVYLRCWEGTRGGGLWLTFRPERCCYAF